MRHRKAGRSLKRSSGHRRALYRNLMTELFRHERIQTTEAKARAVRPLAERMLTKARKARARAEKRARADENAVKFGRTKAEKAQDKAAAEKTVAHLDAHKREEP